MQEFCEGGVERASYKPLRLEWSQRILMWGINNLVQEFLTLFSHFWSKLLRRFGRETSPQSVEVFERHHNHTCGKEQKENIRCRENPIPGGEIAVEENDE